MFLKSSRAAEVWKIQKISQYVNQAVALDLVGRFVICCKICSIWDLAEFHFLVAELYANLVLAPDLVETVLIGCNFARFGDLAGFHFLVPKYEGFPCIFIRRSPSDVNSIILWNVTFQSSAWVAHDPEQGALTGYCQLEPAEPRSHVVVVGRVDTP